MSSAAQTSSGRVCWHPNCTSRPRPNQVVCGWHWYALSSDLRDRLRTATTVEKDTGLPLHAEALEQFKSQMIGSHEVRLCRGENCRARIVRLKGRRRDGSPYHVWVLAESVEPDDTVIDWSRHKRHHCPHYRGARAS